MSSDGKAAEPAYTVCSRPRCLRRYTDDWRFCRSGGCGRCPKHCTHGDIEGQWDPDEAALSDVLLAAEALTPCTACQSIRVVLVTRGDAVVLLCLACGEERETAVGRGGALQPGP